MTQEGKHNYRANLNIVEWLVVITIIGILASTIGVSLMGARASSRDAERQINIRRISTAMELYYNKNIAYIQSADIPTAIGDFLNPVPKDSDIDSSGYGWVDNSVSGSNDNQDYCVYAALEKSPSIPGYTVYFIAGSSRIAEKELPPDFIFTLDDCG